MHYTPTTKTHLVFGTPLPNATGGMRYSPNVGEEEFCELRQYGVLGS
jgi:hypothetical protein